MRGLIGLCFLLLNLVVVPMSAAQSAESDEAEANPGRPTVSTPATLTPVGYLQFETGVLGAVHSPDLPNQVSFNEVIKFSPTSRLELLLQTQPFARSDLGAFRSKDPGDLSLGLQAVLVPGTERRPTI